jgi:hypothetical protein
MSELLRLQSAGRCETMEPSSGGNSHLPEKFFPAVRSASFGLIWIGLIWGSSEPALPL